MVIEHWSTHAFGIVVRNKNISLAAGNPSYASRSESILQRGHMHKTHTSVVKVLEIGKLAQVSERISQRIRETEPGTL